MRKRIFNGETLKVNYTKVREGRYLRTLELDGKILPTKRNFVFVKNPDKDFVKIKKGKF